MPTTENKPDNRIQFRNAVPTITTTDKVTPLTSSASNFVTLKNPV